MNLPDPIFTDETKAREHFEAIRWPQGPYCPHCGETQRVYRIDAKTLNTRAGVIYCNACEKPFSVTVGTVMERSHVPLNKWALAFHLMTASKKGFSAHQLHRTLGVTYKTAWFMAHRIREAMRPLAADAGGGQLGGTNKVVEVDETYVGGKARNRKNHVPPKEAVVALVERDGRVRSHHVANVDGANLRPILKAEIDKASYVMTDESPVYPSALGGFGGHGTVNHSIEEYVRGGFWHTNTVESYFSILKRGVIGTYHHISPEHLKRYLGEFDFRHNERMALGVDDSERAAKAIKGAAGKRLTYGGSGRSLKAESEIPF
jgi:transposase-like protein